MEKSKDAYKFNCAQRAHVQLLENMPQTMLSMIVGGLTYPRLVAAMGLGWTISRILFAYGYITSDKPAGKGRYLGGFFWLFPGGNLGNLRCHCDEDGAVSCYCSCKYQVLQDLIVAKICESLVKGIDLGVVPCPCFGRQASFESFNIVGQRILSQRVTIPF